MYNAVNFSTLARWWKFRGLIKLLCQGIFPLERCVTIEIDVFKASSESEKNETHNLP